jgi:hypothetical protein
MTKKYFLSIFFIVFAACLFFLGLAPVFAQTSLKAPIISKAIFGSDKVAVFWWPASGGIEPYTYHVYRGGDEINADKMVGSTTGLSYVDTNVPAGRHTYWVTVSDSSGGDDKVSNYIYPTVVSGKVSFSSDAAAGTGGTFVSAWSEGGVHAEAVAAQDGSYELKVPSKGSWHIAAAKIKDSMVYRSGESAVSVSQDTVKDIVMINTNIPVPASKETTAVASQPGVLELSDGMKIEAPASSIASSGQVKLAVSPTIEVASQNEARPFALAYDINATVNGTKVSNFVSDIKIPLPYKDVYLQSAGMSAEQLVPGYFDETTFNWVKINKYTLDKTNKAFVVYTNHLTRFALLAPADTTPPADPTNIKIASASSTSLLLTWTEPSFDYHHTRIYRSTVAGQVGTLTYDSVTGGSKTDTNLTTGKTYYYVLRSVDPFGNESANTATLAGIPGAATQPSSTVVKEGDLVKGPDGIKVYIVNGFGYKRHIFNPAVFKMYSHFKWNEVKSLTQAELDAYKSSDFYRGEGDAKVFSLEEVDEAKGIAKKRWLDISGDEFTRRGYSWDQVFNINTVEKNYYGTGDPIK